MNYIKKISMMLSRKQVVLLVVVLLGMAILFFVKPHQDAPVPPPLPKVVVTESQAKSIVQDLRINGHTQAARTVTLRAETSGRVEKILVEKGQTVRLHEELITLSEEDRLVRLQEAKALVKQRAKEFASGNKLKAKAFQAENALVAQEALLASAHTLLAKIEKEIQNTHIQAPFVGTLDQRFVEIGDFVSCGERLATIVELDPLLVLCHIAEKDIAQLQEDKPVTIYLPSFGCTSEGKICYISSTADSKTRTFSVEIMVANPEAKIPGGVTAQVILCKGEILGHKIASSYVSLNDEGLLGIKVVEAGKVNFIPVTLLNTTLDGVWVAGLPEKVQIITVGADFVSVGQDVEIQQATQE